MTNGQKLKEVALVFLKMGTFAFGGPAVHISLMEAEIVRKRKWITHEHFLDLVGATNLIPGPNSTEMTMHCGHERAGRTGLFVAGISFIIPAILITGVFAWFYAAYGDLPSVAPFLEGIKPAVLAIILAAVFKLGKKSIKSTEHIILGVLVLVICLLGVSEIVAMIGAGIVGMFYKLALSKQKDNPKAFIPFLLVSAPSLATKLSSASVFFSFLKVGALLYGSGMVLFAYLDAELVSNGWLTQQQLIDAVAVGQFTPGPVLSTATFIGYQLNGLGGAIAATAGIFLPSFLFVLLLNPIIPKMRKSLVFGYFLDAVNVAAVAVIAAVLVTMSKATLIDWRPVLIAILAGIVVFRMLKISVIWVIVGGAVFGYFLSLV
jgi:chromate transporter|tara:strand:+ start:2863 stop:3990 length:1128 start_codon:yes stop_codon:yes gene_type:complete